MMTAETQRQAPDSQPEPSPKSTKPPKIRARGQLRVMAAIVLGVSFTLSSAAASLMPGGPRPPERRPIDDELDAIVAERKARIAELERAAPGERCHPAGAHELARLLVMDGRWPDVRRFADAYEQRCGEDPVVRSWGDAPVPRPRR
ncbi:MAG TPA: hypothetical protein VNO30_03320 [Kofleriaceae bacterium]|nr:hypothetical protein [Kofleriaceae bacterium]